MIETSDPRPGSASATPPRGRNPACSCQCCSNFTRVSARLRVAAPPSQPEPARDDVALNVASSRVEHAPQPRRAARAGHRCQPCSRCRPAPGSHPGRAGSHTLELVGARPRGAERQTPRGHYYTRERGGSQGGVCAGCSLFLSSLFTGYSLCPRRLYWGYVVLGWGVDLRVPQAHPSPRPPEVAPMETRAANTFTRVCTCAKRACPQRATA